MVLSASQYWGWSLIHRDLPALQDQAHYQYRLGLYHCSSGGSSSSGGGSGSSGSSGSSGVGDNNKSKYIY